MNYSMQSHGDQLTVHLAGALEFDSHPEFKEVISAISQSGECRICFDLSGLTNLDAAGIGMLFLAQERSQKVSKNIHMSGAKGRVAEVLSLVNIDDRKSANVTVSTGA